MILRQVRSDRESVYECAVGGGEESVPWGREGPVYIRFQPRRF